MRDVLQEADKLKKPQIRVWCCPVRGGRDPREGDYYHVFDSLSEALRFASATPAAEDRPLVAYGGYEMTVEEFYGRYPDKVIR